MTIAKKTLAAIEAAMRADRGASFREWQRITLPQCEDAYRGFDPPFRKHLGASVIGTPCSRKLWYQFRWAWDKPGSPQMLRLWNRGHLEEGRMIAMLKMIGCTIYQHDSNGKQFRMSLIGGHFGGSCDGVAVGLPDYEPGFPSLTEYKTHNRKSFEKLVDKGLREAKFEHYVQMNLYMKHLDLTWGLYLAVNKDTDELHGELVSYDPRIASMYEQKASAIVLSPVPPPMINPSASWWECQFCDMRPVCRTRKEQPEVNCRTCRMSQPVDGGWYCNAHPAANSENGLLPEATQRAGCTSHEFIPELWNSATIRTTR